MHATKTSSTIQCSIQPLDLFRCDEPHIDWATPSFSHPAIGSRQDIAAARSPSAIADSSQLCPRERSKAPPCQCRDGLIHRAEGSLLHGASNREMQ